MTFSPRSRDQLIAHLKSGSNDTISFEHLDRVVNYEPDEMIVMCEPGITLQALEEQLRERGQWIPALVASERNERTLGEAIMSNAYHPRMRTASPLATTVLGGTFVTLSGEVFKSGSRVVKSVAGYDTHRAFVGSRGALGHILEITLKVLPRPSSVYRFIAPTGSERSLAKFEPTVNEAIEDGILSELMGHAEDVEIDVASLREAGLVQREITDEWGSLIRSIGANPNPVTTDVRLDKLMLALSGKLA